jgi:subtilisin family serine protease
MKSAFISCTNSLKILLEFLVLVICFGCQKESLDSANALLPASLSTVQKSVKINNYMVITKSETLPAGFETQLSAYGRIVLTMPQIGTVVVEPKVSDFKSKVTKLTEVQSVVPDYNARWIEPVNSIALPRIESIGDNETFFYYQWGMNAIHAPEAWSAGYTGKGATVFILDEGIIADNPDLAPNLNISLCTSFVPGESYDANDALGFNHGTHVAGIIAAADNNWGVIGVAPGTEIVAVKVISESTGSGAFSWINAGILYAADHQADVINMSLGATLYRNGFYLDGDGVKQPIPVVDVQNLCFAQQRAINYAYKKGAVIVASAGNDAISFDGGGPLIKIPGGLQKVITVSASAPKCWVVTETPFTVTPDANFDIPASYTDYGKTFVELAAPGGDFVCDGPYWYYDMVFSSGNYSAPYWHFYLAAGTSMSAPHVTGVAALVIGKNGGRMSPADVTIKLLNTADKIDGKAMLPYFGYGRVNAFRAVTE